MFFCKHKWTEKEIKKHESVLKQIIKLPPRMEADKKYLLAHAPFIHTNSYLEKEGRLHEYFVKYYFDITEIFLRCEKCGDQKIVRSEF